MRRSQRQPSGWSYGERVRAMDTAKENHMFNPLYSELFERPTKHCRDCGRIESEHAEGRAS